MNEVLLKVNEDVINTSIMFDYEIMKEIREVIFLGSSNIFPVRNKEIIVFSEEELKYSEYAFDKHYKNFSYKIIKNEGFCNSITALISYDYYDYPEVIDLIDSILQSKGLDLINNYSKLLEHFDYLEKKHNRVTYELSKGVKRADLLEDYEEIIKYQRYKNHYFQVQKLIEFKNIGFSSRENAINIDSFPEYIKNKAIIDLYEKNKVSKTKQLTLEKIA